MNKNKDSNVKIKNVSIKNKKSILIMIFMLLFVIISGTYAWYSYRSNEMAMVLTVGDIDKIKVTLAPYQINTSFASTLSYEENEYTKVTAINYMDQIAVFDLYYQIDNIDSALVSEYFKYTILRSIDGGTTYEEYLTGDFSSASSGDKLSILNTEVISNNTTYLYLVYLWIDGSETDNTAMEGAVFKGELRATISEAGSNTFLYTGDYQKYVVPEDGYYFIEAYGASGGAANGYVPGYGAYTSGVIELKTGDKLYIYVGGRGETGVKTASTTTAGGYNGGGSGYVGYTAYYVGGGGGATDIRYFGSTEPSESDLVWNSTLGLNSRIMVAAGGAGRSYYTTSYRTITTASGGYLIGEEAVGNSSSSSGVLASGGKQNGAGDNGAIMGIFGVGASAGKNSGYPGAGGGYYGGNTNSYAAGGGSSFISGYAGVNAITSSNDRTHTNNTLHYSGKYFINGKMENYANSGDGGAKITYLGTDSPYKIGSNYGSVRYIKDCKGKRTIVAGDDTDNTCYKCRNWKEIQAIKDGVNLAKGKTITIDGSISSWTTDYPKANATDGIITSSAVAYASSDDGIVCAIVDLGSTYELDEVVTWANNYGYFANHTLSVSTDGNTWTQIASIGSASGIQGMRAGPYTIQLGYSYSGTEKTKEISTSGCYKFEVWGASGGSTAGSGAVYTLRGGLGGYARGFKYLEAGQTLYINVGGAGSDVNKWAVASGGYNGGGNGSAIYSSGSASQGNLHAAGGGGATHIATSSGLLSSLSSKKDSVLIVAGGGGGSASNEGNYDEGYYAYHYGGSAGGYKGNSSSNYTYGSGTGWATFTLSTGGSQTSGGVGGGGWESTSNPNVCNTSSTPYRCYVGTFGQGGTLSNDWTPTNASYGGGGGGYYGGGMGYYMAGGGGSSYIGGIDSLGVLVGYNVVASNVASIRTRSIADYSYYTVTSMPKRGNGFARIYYVGSVCPYVK